MTNVPNDIREMWADVYRLFDVSYNMKNDAESWKRFWDSANQIRDKYECPELIGLLMVVSDMIEGHITDKKLQPSALEDMTLF